MPDIQLTDELDQPIEPVTIDLSHPSSLVEYLKSEALHLAVFPDFVAIKDKLLSQAGSNQFFGAVKHGFQLGDTQREIDITPAAQARIRINTKPGGNLFEDDLFPAAVTVPEQTGYASLGFQGSLDLGLSGSAGDLTFGFGASSGVNLEYVKAFPLGDGEPTLGTAVAQTLGAFVIPADLSNVESLAIDDIATASGEGSLKVSGGVKLTVSPNPLASVDLPLNAGTASVKVGAAAGLSVEFAISGAYQIRARRQDADTIELSFLRKRGTSLSADFSASAGVTAGVGSTDLIAALLGAISTDPARDKELFADLKPVEIHALTSAIQAGANHSLQASVNLVLSEGDDHQAVFQYEIQPALLSDAARLAIGRALAGDLSLLTGMEDAIGDGGVLAPGLKMLQSVLSETRKRGCTLKLNLLGILNYSSVWELIRNSEVLTDEVTGDVTIKETVSGTRITAITEPLARNEALRKAIFDSLLITSSYRAGKAVAVPELSSEQVHFAMNQNTNQQIMSDYLRWFVALNLLTGGETGAIMSGFTDGGASTCVLRTSFRDTDCEAMFFDTGGQLRTSGFYVETGRQALRALLDPEYQAIDALRSRLLDDGVWPGALQTGANVELGPLVGLSRDDPHVEYLIGDVLDITAWADAVAAAGALVQKMRQSEDAALKSVCDALQKKMSGVVKASKMRFDEPWGMVCLFWAAGKPVSAYGKAVMRGSIVLERGSIVWAANLGCSRLLASAASQESRRPPERRLRA